MKIKDMPDDLRPDERARAYGIDSLTDRELLAIIIRTGTSGKSSLELADEILSVNKGKRGLLNLMNCTYKDLTQLKGLGDVKAMQLACVCELSKRISKVKVLAENRTVDSDFAAGYYMDELRSLTYEVIYIMAVDMKGRFIRSILVSKGSSRAAAAGMREILKLAISSDASGIYMVHNHPSGCTVPSRQDIRFSAALKTAAESVGIVLCDSIIIGNGGYCSLSRKGLL